MKTKKKNTTLHNYLFEVGMYFENFMIQTNHTVVRDICLKYEMTVLNT